MKAPLFLILFSLLITGAYCQNAYYASIASNSDNDRMALMKNSVSVSEWHEKSFWSLYDRYSDDVNRVSIVTRQSVDSLLSMPAGLPQKEFSLASRILTNQHRLHEIQTQYFSEMNTTLSGITALEFLQTELMMDVLDNLKLYERDSSRGYKFYPWLHTADKLPFAKRDAIINAIRLEPGEAPVFFAVYGHYEKECDDLLGENYNLFELFNESPEDFSPGLAKVQGSNLLRLLQRENTLKEQYFMEMNKIGGASLAARFVLWEDYYSTVNKMYALSSDSN